MLDVEIVANLGCELGEGPLWHPQEKCLYWTDITQGLLHRYTPASGRCECVLEGRPIAGVTRQADGSLLLFRDRGTIEVFRNGRIAETIVAEIPEESGHRFNDVIADSCGRVFCGTMAPNWHEVPGRLYCIDTDGSYRLVLEQVGLPNGMGFTPDRRHIYLTDSANRTIYSFDYDSQNGVLANRQVFAEVKPPALPDGLTVDEAGNVWSACWDGSCVICYAPNGSIEKTLSLPTPNVTSVTFGGDDYADLYITSAAIDCADSRYAGALFRIRKAGRGCPEFPSDIQSQPGQVATSERHCCEAIGNQHQYEAGGQ